jgi:hypothetical protein
MREDTVVGTIEVAACNVAACNILTVSPLGATLYMLLDHRGEDQAGFTTFLIPILAIIAASPLIGGVAWILYTTTAR